MGFKQKAENLKYVGVRFGMLSYKTDANDSHPNLVKRPVTDDNGNVTANNYYVEFPAFEGYITNLNVKDITFNNKQLTFLDVTVEDNDDRILLQLKWTHPMTRYFLAKLPNIDFMQPVEFAAGKDKRDYNTLYVKQGGFLVPMYYTRENPRDKPAWEPLKNKKGEIVQWDMSAEDEFYRKMINDSNNRLTGTIQRPAPVAATPAPEPTPKPTPEPVVDDFGDDDLPF
jgi:hypothetical protein